MSIYTGFTSLPMHPKKASHYSDLGGPTPAGTKAQVEKLRRTIDQVEDLLVSAERGDLEWASTDRWASSRYAGLMRKRRKVLVHVLSASKKILKKSLSEKKKAKKKAKTQKKKQKKRVHA